MGKQLDTCYFFFKKNQCFSKNKWQVKIEIEECIDILFLHFTHHTHNPQLHPFPSHTFPLPCICKWSDTRKKFETLLESSQVPILYIFDYQPRFLLKEENKRTSQTDLGCKILTAESLLERIGKNRIKLMLLGCLTKIKSEISLGKSMSFTGN